MEDIDQLDDEEIIDLLNQYYSDQDHPIYKAAKKLAMEREIFDDFLDQLDDIGL
jgi:hypothetical protein